MDRRAQQRLQSIELQRVGHNCVTEQTHTLESAGGEEHQWQGIICTEPENN